MQQVRGGDVSKQLTKNLCGERDEVVKVSNRERQLPGDADESTDKDILPMNAAELFGSGNEIVEFRIDLAETLFPDGMRFGDVCSEFLNGHLDLSLFCLTERRVGVGGRLSRVQQCPFLGKRAPEIGCRYLYLNQSLRAPSLPAQFNLFAICSTVSRPGVHAA